MKAARAVLAFMLAAACGACATNQPPRKRSVNVAAANCLKPEYPAAAIRSEATGVTRLKVEVNPEGTTTSVIVVLPSGAARQHRLLDRAAVAAFQQCKFPPEPGTVAADATINVVWQLQ
jgi:periplasmic protein TonB